MTVAWFERNLKRMDQDEYDNAERIIQIIPAVGWQMLWDMGEPELTDLMGFGLQQNGTVVPLDADSDGLVDNLLGAENFVALLSPTEDRSEEILQRRVERHREGKI